MWLKKIFFYILHLIKYLVFGSIITIIIGIFFPPAALIAGGIFLIGAFGAAKSDLDEKTIPKIERKLALKDQSRMKEMYKKDAFEWAEFDKMLDDARRNI